jgi:glycosyltransferase involved in cell wall biosynthesis
LKLLFYISSLSGGGAERVTANLANYWANQGWQVTVVTLSSQSEDFYPLHHSIGRIALGLQGESSHVFRGTIQNIRRVLALRRVLCQIKPDVAIGMMAAANIVLALASWRLVKIITIGSERTYPPKYPLGRAWEWLRKHSYSRLNVVVAQTTQGAEWINAHTLAKRVVAIPNPIAWPLVNCTPNVDVDKFCHADRKLLLAVGRLTEEKQFNVLISCFEKLVIRHPAWDLIILGEGNLRTTLSLQIKNAGLEGRIFLPGRVGNMGNWFSRANLYTLCSRFEGFPNTLVEAMAYGLAVVSVDCDTGPRDIIRHDVDGLLVAVDDVEGFTKALEHLISDVSLRERLAVRALDVRERFAVDRIANMWEEIFLEVK